MSACAQGMWTFRSGWQLGTALKAAKTSCGLSLATVLVRCHLESNHGNMEVTQINKGLKAA